MFVLKRSWLLDYETVDVDPTIQMTLKKKKCIYIVVRT